MEKEKSRIRGVKKNNMREMFGVKRIDTLMIAHFPHQIFSSFMFYSIFPFLLKTLNDLKNSSEA